MRKLENRLKKLEKAEVAITSGPGFEKPFKDPKLGARLIETEKAFVVKRSCKCPCDKALEDARFG